MVIIAIMNFHELMVCDILATLNALMMIDLEVAGTAEIPHVLDWFGDYVSSKISFSYHMLELLDV